MFLYNLAQFLVLNLTLNIKLDPKMWTLKTWKKFGKPRKKFEKTCGNPVITSDLPNSESGTGRVEISKMYAEPARP